MANDPADRHQVTEFATINPDEGRKGKPLRIENTVLDRGFAQVPNGWWQVFERSGSRKIPTYVVATAAMHCAMCTNTQAVLADKTEIPEELSAYEIKL
ncbi:phage tail protein [Salmonella enterica subsp. enterica]|nr:phage tail protein [Salmonella enterica subsp. enterica]